MEVRPGILARAISDRPMHLAVFDVSLREQTGQWYLDEHISLRDVIDRLAEDDAFREESGTLQLPLHESASAALSEEFLRVDPSTGTIQFYDPGVGRIRRLGIDDVERTYAAWRARFWTDAFQIEEMPPFVQALASDEEEHAPQAPESPAIVNAELPSEAFFEAVRSALVAMRERQREQMRTSFERLPPQEFLDDNGGVTGVTPAGRRVDEYGQQTIELQVPDGHELAGASTTDLRERTRLGPGDEVVIDSRGLEALPVEAELFSISPDRLELGVYWDSAKGGHAEEAFDADESRRMTVGRLIDGTRYQAIAEAIDTVDRTDHARGRYAGDAEPAFQDPPDWDPPDRLNSNQENAVRRGLATRNVLCVHTPPWTGVRRVIWSLLEAAVDGGDRVLLCSPTSESLDRLIGRASAEQWSMVERAEEAEIELSMATSPTDDVDGADAMAISLDAAGAVSDHSADLAIVDHAARIDVPTGAIPFAKAARVVLLGDPWQGPPPTMPGEPTGDLARSIYDHLVAVNRDATVPLRSQYRMNEAIAQFPNRRFYEGTLVNGGKNRTWTIDTLAPLEAVHIPTDVQSTPTGSVYHDGEIDAVLDEVETLLDRGVEPERIGILTPFSAQIGKLRVALNELEGGLDEAILVDSLDGFRCQSRDAVIVSFVGTADPSTSLRGEGAAFETVEGLNVALTRAQRRLVFVADWEAMRERGGTYTALCDFLEERGLVESAR